MYAVQDPVLCLQQPVLHLRVAAQVRWLLQGLRVGRVVGLLLALLQALTLQHQLLPAAEVLLVVLLLARMLQG
jgi:type III secretory pathway component EscS